MNNIFQDVYAPNIATSLLQNKILIDRITMLQTMTDENEHQRNITIDNIYRIAFAMFNDGRSFILPYRMMKDLFNLNRLLQSDKEALLYVRRYENKICA